MGEFFVAVFSGDVKTKTYKIKTKYQAKMQLAYSVGMSSETASVRAPEAQAVAVMPAPPVMASAPAIEQPWRFKLSHRSGARISRLRLSWLLWLPCLTDSLIRRWSPWMRHPRKRATK
jgi:hypothetical protein